LATARNALANHYRTRQRRSLAVTRLADEFRQLVGTGETVGDDTATKKAFSSVSADDRMLR
jgi:hypothetical protein